MRKIRRIAICISLILTFVACGQNTENTTTPAVSQSPEEQTTTIGGVDTEDIITGDTVTTEDVVSDTSDKVKVEYKPVSNRLENLILSNGELDKYSYEGASQGSSYDENYLIAVEMEDGTTSGNAVVNSDASGFSGSGYVDIRGNASEDTVSIAISVPASGTYDIKVNCAFPYGEKANDITIDGEMAGTIHGLETNAAFSEYTIEGVYIGEGEHILAVKPSWGWWQIDNVTIAAVKQSEKQERDKSKAELIDPYATLEAKMLYQFIVDMDGNHILSGQVGDYGTSSNEYKSILETTGRTPAVLGLDMMSYSPARAKHGEQSQTVNKAKQFCNKEGGIVTICWHWTIDEKYDKEGAEYWRGFYSEYLDLEKLNLTGIMNGEDPEGMETILTDIDSIAFYLKQLQEANVPILWRPLHEASGGWFWWGAYGPETYIKLWKLLYDRLVNYHDLHNLIWVWNAQNPEWYPGDEYCDVISTDIYPGNHVYTSNVSTYNELVSVTNTYKPIALSENGCLFDPDLAIRDNAAWTWFCTWGGEFTTANGTISEQYTEIPMWDKVFNHTSVITLDELPDLTKYGLE